MTQPIKGQAYDFYVGLDDINESFSFVTNPTIEAGDFQVSVDGGALANITTLPVVTPSGSQSVKVSLSASEMSGDKVVVLGSDAADDEWGDIQAFLDLETGTTQTVIDILEGDHVETRDRLIINKKDTTDSVLDKSITGSLLSASVTIQTLETT